VRDQRQLGFRDPRSGTGRHRATNLEPMRSAQGKSDPGLPDARRKHEASERRRSPRPPRSRRSWSRAGKPRLSRPLTDCGSFTAKSVYILCNIPLDLPVDELVTWNQLTGDRRLSDALAEVRELELGSLLFAMVVKREGVQVSGHQVSVEELTASPRA
jgi:hypothetical protein